MYYKGSEKNCFSASLCLQYRTKDPVCSQAFLSTLGSFQQVDPGPPVHQGSAARHSDLSTTCLCFLFCLLSFFDSIVSCRTSLFSSYVRNLLSQLIFPTGQGSHTVVQHGQRRQGWHDVLEQGQLEGQRILLSCGR